MNVWVHLSFQISVKIQLLSEAYRPSFCPRLSCPPPSPALPPHHGRSSRSAFLCLRAASFDEHTSCSSCIGKSLMASQESAAESPLRQRLLLPLSHGHLCLHAPPTPYRIRPLATRHTSTQEKLSCGPCPLALVSSEDMFSSFGAGTVLQ